MSNDRKKTMSDIFGDSDDDEDEDSFKLAPTTAATPGPTAKTTIAAATSGLFGSDSSSEDEKYDDNDDDNSDEDYTTTLKKKTSKKRKSTASTSSRKKIKTSGGKLKRGQPTTKRRTLKDDDSDDSDDAEASKKPRPVLTKTRPRLHHSGDEYDSGEEIERQKEDDDFIDGEDDLAHVLGEYDGDTQQFRDERPDADDASMLRGRREEDEEEGNFFDQTMKSLKTSKRRGKVHLSPVELEQMAQEILYRMDTAFSNDLQTLSEGQPGLEKIKFLRTATSILSKVQFQPTLLDFNLLEILKKWIQPHETSGQLPNVGIRTKLLQITKRLPIYKDHLKRSGFGKVIMILWKHPDETVENKDICRELIERWSRSVFDKTLDYRKLAELESEKKGETSVDSYRSVRVQNQPPSTTTRSNMLRDSSSFESLGTLSSEGTRVRIPTGIRMDFVHRPQPKDETRKSESALAAKTSSGSRPGVAGDSKKQKLARRMQDIARPARKNVRAITMSVEGRGS